MEKIIKKVSFDIGAIKRVTHLVPHRDLRATLPSSLPSPQLLQYCLEKLWDNLKEQTSKTTKIEQPVFWHFSDYDEDVGYLFELLGWKNLARQHGIEKATMVYKYLHGLAPEYLCSRFAIRETGYNLRDSENKPCISLPRTNYLQK